MKNETLNELESRFDYMLDKLKMFEIRMSDDGKISKFADALPAECDDILKNLKKDSWFSKLRPNGFINMLKTHMYENNKKKKKELMNEITGNLDKMSLDVIVELKRRVCVCLAAKYHMKYDIKMGCYIDENMNPLDFVKIFCADTYKTETEQIPKNEESVKLESSNSEPVSNKKIEANAPIFDHSSDEESDDESVQVEKK
ncbi:hypothetical protein Hanom_Chr10g00887031 [Helianthus anomalus]